MLKSIQLQNYRRHVDLAITFQPGINAIRAANEAGKSTLLSAIAYAFFGSKALDEPLDDVVTYGVPVSKLKVAVDFALYGIDYQLTRGKSGAELCWQGGRVTGQTEVTKACEALFKTDAAMAGKLMIAAQQDLRGALSAGPTAAGEMIEQLANFGLFDDVIDAIQTDLPCGDTTSVKARIAMLRDQAAGVATAVDLAPLRAAAATAEGARVASANAVAALAKQHAELDVVLAHVVLADQKALAAQIERDAAQMATLAAAVAAPLPEAPTTDSLDAARAAVEAQKSAQRALALRDQLERANIVPQWEGDTASLNVEVASATEKAARALASLTEAQADQQDTLRQLTARQAKYNQDVAVTKVRAITDSTCALCHKDLTDVPEVVATNAQVAERLATLEREFRADEESLQASGQAEDKHILAATAAMKEANDYLAALQGVLAEHRAAELLFAQAGEFVQLERNTVPARWTWVGPTVVGDEGASLRLGQLEAAQREALQASARHAEMVAQYDGVSTQHQAATQKLAALPVKDAQETLDLAADVAPKLVAARQVLDQAGATAQEARRALDMAEQANTFAEQNLAQARTQLTAAEAEQVEMEANNALVKKVRDARPQVANKLWNLSLGAVSNYFGQVRGTPSAITREGKVFKVNGRPVSGLSGSAKDMLGLSLRAALTKVFLPACPFMILDEAAAACDDERETAMLGLLTTLDFDQIILVTHSDLVDAYADHVITL